MRVLCIRHVTCKRYVQTICCRYVQTIGCCCFSSDPNNLANGATLINKSKLNGYFDVKVTFEIGGLEVDA